MRAMESSFVRQSLLSSAYVTPSAAKPKTRSKISARTTPGNLGALPLGYRSGYEKLSDEALEDDVPGS
jgi:hypothetical protein